MGFASYPVSDTPRSFFLMTQPLQGRGYLQNRPSNPSILVLPLSIRAVWNRRCLSLPIRARTGSLNASPPRLHRSPKPGVAGSIPAGPVHAVPTRAAFSRPLRPIPAKNRYRAVPLTRRIDVPWMVGNHGRAPPREARVAPPDPGHVPRGPRHTVRAKDSQPRYPQRVAAGQDFHRKLLSRRRDLPGALLPGGEAHRHGQVLPDPNAVKGRGGLEDPHVPVRPFLASIDVHTCCSGRACTDTPSLTRDNRCVVNRDSRVERSHLPAGRVDGLEPQVVRRIPHHEIHRAAAEHIVDRSAPKQHRSLEAPERCAKHGIAGSWTRDDAIARDGERRPRYQLEPHARVRQYMAGPVEHLHRELHRSRIIDQDGIAEAHDEARRWPVAGRQSEEQ